MGDKPLVYAVVLNCNGEKWLTRCLTSLLASSYEPFQVVLVDNGSTDKSVELARGISSRIHIIETRANLGFCEANNRAIAYALERAADYISLLNNDTYFEPDWLRRIIEVGEANPQVGILGPVQLVFDNQEFNTWMTTALPGMLEMLRRHDEPGFWAAVDWVEGSGLVAKRRVFETIGCLDPIFFIFFEESDLCRRARASGFQVAIVPSSKIHHHRGGFFDRPQVNRRRAFLLLRNSMIYNSTDPRRSFLGNFIALLRNNAVHLKDSLLGRQNLLLWWQASWSVFARLPFLYRKWQTDRIRILRSCRAAAESCDASQ